VTYCLTEEEEYALWRDQYDWNQDKQIMDEKWRENEDVGSERMKMRRKKKV
jgi:hypothetical protein